MTVIRGARTKLGSRPESEIAMSAIGQQLAANAEKPHPEPGPEVSITINGTPKSIHRGHETVIAIKNLGGVPLADDLDQLVDGKLIPLPDDGAVTVKGGEQFISHPKDNASA
jgi:hypothetical protein